MGDLKRYALAIGNFEYEFLDMLKTPENDCTAVGKKLKEPLGFQVTTGINKSCREIYTLINSFMKQPEDNLSDIVFYYSGHGCSIQGKNYIIPIDGAVSSEFLASRTYVLLDDIISSLVQFRRLDTVPIIFILDCCRSESITQDQEQSNELVKDDRHTNIFIIYSTGNNQVAFDGSGVNGTFTELLLARMDTDEDIESIAKNILTNLHDQQSYRNTQVSWTGSSLLKPYNFRTASKENKTPISPQENLFWPKYPENLLFVDRPEVFKELDCAIKKNRDGNQFRPIVLCGLGGIGKSQIALKFCYRNKDNYRYIIWMDADTETALQSSFLDVAKMLDLPGFVYSKPENIAPQMITWFHNNDEWLLVFDNCDDYSFGFASENRRLQNKYFPKKGKGIILMTTRNNFAEEDELVINLDEMKMEDSLALELLMKKKVDITKIDPNALEVVKQLGHLPLAVDLTGALMKREKLTPADFLKKYNEDPAVYLDLADIQEQIGSSYGKTVLTVWNASFNRIKIKNPLSASLLRYTALLYHDDMPFALFINQKKLIFKPNETLSPRTLSAAVNLLKDFSLIRRTIRESSSGNSYTKDTLTIHRLVQTVILLDMDLQEKKECYERLIASLSQEVPPELMLNSENSKKIMEAYVPHIRHIIVQFGQWTDERCSNSKELISLLSSTVTYLTRQGLFEGVEYLAELCVSISEKNNGLLHPDTAAALSKLSYVHVCQSHFKAAEPHSLQSLRIRRKIFGPTHKDTISALHDLAYIYNWLGMDKHSTQLHWEAAITGDGEAQRYLATRYEQGIGASIHEGLSSYWRNRSLEKESSDKPIPLNTDVRMTPLHYAIQQGDVDKIRTRFADYKQYATIGDRDGKISLHTAVENGNIEIVKVLLKEVELDKNIQDNQGQTPLHLAAKNGDVIMVKLLITEFGADPNIMTINKKTPAELAANNGHFEIMNLILHETVTTNLDLEGSKIGAKGARALAEGLKKNIILTNLNLTNNGIGDDGARGLAEGLKVNIALISLNLQHNSIGDEGARALADGLKQNRALINLNLSYNSIGDECARDLAEGLKMNIALTSLNLKNNNIGDEGAHALVEGLKQNTTLTELNLSESNTILRKTQKRDSDSHKFEVRSEYTEEDISRMKLDFELNAIDITEAVILNQESTVIELNLSNQALNISGAKILANFLRHNTTLTGLNLDNNSIGNEGARALAEGLKQNTALISLNLENNSIDAENARALIESLKHNPTLKVRY